MGERSPREKKYCRTIHNVTAVEAVTYVQSLNGTVKKLQLFVETHILHILHSTRYPRRGSASLPFSIRSATLEGRRWDCITSSDGVEYLRLPSADSRFQTLRSWFFIRTVNYKVFNSAVGHSPKSANVNKLGRSKIFKVLLDVGHFPTFQKSPEFSTPFRKNDGIKRLFRATSRTVNILRVIFNIAKIPGFPGS